MTRLDFPANQSNLPATDPQTGSPSPSPHERLRRHGQRHPPPATHRPLLAERRRSKPTPRAQPKAATVASLSFSFFLQTYEMIRIPNRSERTLANPMPDVRSVRTHYRTKRRGFPAKTSSFTEAFRSRSPCFCASCPCFCSTGQTRPSLGTSPVSRYLTTGLWMQDTALG